MATSPGKPMSHSNFSPGPASSSAFYRNKHDASAYVQSSNYHSRNMTTEYNSPLRVQKEVTFAPISSADNSKLHILSSPGNYIRPYR